MNLILILLATVVMSLLARLLAQPPHVTWPDDPNPPVRPRWYD